MTPRPHGNMRHAFLFTALCLLLVCPPAARASSPRRAAPPPRQEDEPRAARRPIQRPGRAERVGKTILKYLLCGEENLKMKDELLKYGPYFSDGYDPSDFSFHALLRGGWTMAFAYELESRGTAVITIKVKDAAPFTRRLNGGGMGQPQTVLFAVPDYRPGLHPARISVRATRPGPSGEERAELLFHGAAAGDDLGARLRAPDGLEVAGLGPLPLGGVRAVLAPPARALNIYDVTLSRGQGDYVYAFYAGDKFNRWAADIMTNVRRRNHDVAQTLRHVAVVEEPIGPRWNPVTGNWDGLDGRGRRVRGVQAWVFVRAWLSAASQGAWAVQNSSARYPIN